MRSPVLYGVLPVASAVLASALLSPTAFAARPGELTPGAHPAANANANGRVVYHYDRSTHAARSAAKPQANPNMTNHGGVVMPTALTQPIFWGTKWAGAAYTGDKISGINDWYAGYSNSNYAKTTTEYVGSNGRVGSATSSLPNLLDTSPSSGGQNSSVILNEVAKALTAAGEKPPADGSGYYPVYTDQPRGGANYCAWHSSGTVNGVRVQFGFFWDLAGDPGCDPGSTVPGHSQGLAALANVTGHELAEAMTDPASPGAWYDSAGSENGDKCAWTFNVPSVTFSNGSAWKVQGEWSNAAYTAGTGYPNSSRQPGCLDGH